MRRKLGFEDYCNEEMLKYLLQVLKQLKYSYRNVVTDYILLYLVC